jgi:hypothetical protein
MWFSSQMKGVPDIDRIRLLQAVGDPFQSTPDLLPSDEQYALPDKYKPMTVAVILIGFTSSGLWRHHLRRSNFTSCEEVTSTVEGKKSAFAHIFAVGWSWRQLFCTPAKIIAAIERLEELQCPNTAEVVLMWAWTSGVVGVVDHDAWGLIGRKTLAFYRTHGMGRLKSLSQHIVNDTVHASYWERQCRVKGTRLPVRIAGLVRRLNVGEGFFTDLPLARVCRLRRLYQLFGCDPAMWGEVVGVERIGEEMDVSLGQSLNPMYSIDCACDYP